MMCHFESALQCLLCVLCLSLSMKLKIHFNISYILLFLSVFFHANFSIQFTFIGLGSYFIEKRRRKIILYCCLDKFHPFYPYRHRSERVHHGTQEEV